MLPLIRVGKTTAVNSLVSQYAWADTRLKKKVYDKSPKEKEKRWEATTPSSLPTVVLATRSDGVERDDEQDALGHLKCAGRFCFTNHIANSVREVSD